MGRGGGGSRNTPLHATETRRSSGLMGHLDDMQTLPWEEKLFIVGVLYISNLFSISIAINFTLSLQGTRVHP